jgi:hypothetical protein
LHHRKNKILENNEKADYFYTDSRLDGMFFRPRLFAGVAHQRFDPQKPDDPAMFSLPASLFTEIEKPEGN